MIDPGCYQEAVYEPPPPAFTLERDARGWLVRHVGYPEILRPEGCSIEAGKLLARRACYALHHCDEDGVPFPRVERAFVWAVFIGGMLAGVMLTGLGTIAWKTATTFLGAAL